jgi:hypothetical protein
VDVIVHVYDNVYEPINPREKKVIFSITNRFLHKVFLGLSYADTALR